jgi:hypothetical protein
VVNTSTGTITVSRAGSDLINGTTSISLRTKYDAVDLASDASSNWYIANRNVTVAAFYTGAPTGTLSGADNLVTFPTKVVDTHGAYSSGTFTVPAGFPGLYHVKAQARVNSSSATANQYFNLVIKQGGAAKATTTLRAEASSIDDRAPIVTAILNCAAGDTIEVYSNTNYSSATWNTSTTNSNIEIMRIGN